MLCLVNTLVLTAASARGSLENGIPHISESRRLEKYFLRKGRSITRKNHSNSIKARSVLHHRIRKLINQLIHRGKSDKTTAFRGCCCSSFFPVILTVESKSGSGVEKNGDDGAKELHKIHLHMFPRVVWSVTLQRKSSDRPQTSQGCCKRMFWVTKRRKRSRTVRDKVSGVRGGASMAPG